MKTLLFLIPIALGLLWKSCQEETPLKNACGGCPKDSTRIEADILYSMPFFGYPSILLEKSHLYDESFLLDNKFVKSGSEAKKALLYGAWWADVAVLSLLDKKKKLPTYFSSLQLIHHDLNITYQIDFENISQFEENSLDTLFNQFITNFNHLACCLASQKKENISTLILFGAWLEQLNYLCLLYEKYPSEELKGIIGRNGLVISEIKMNSSDENKIYSNYLNSLQKKFTKVEIQLYCFAGDELGENKYGEFLVNGKIFYPLVNISDSDFLAIRQEIKRLREELLVN